MNAALAMFSEKGVDATTIEEITERADLGKGTFYRHFSNKDEIMAALVEDAVGHLVELIRASCDKSASLEQVLEHLLDAHCSFFTNSTAKFVLMFQGRLLLNLQRNEAGEFEKPFIDYLEEIESRIAPFLHHRVEPVKVRRLACAVAGFVSGFFSFAMIGMTDGEIGPSVEPLRQAFVAAASMFLESS